MQNHSIKILCCFFLISFFKCGFIENKELIIDSIDIDVKIERFDQKFDSVSNSNINNLKNKYPFLFPNKYDDDFWIKKKNDTIYKLLSTAVSEKFKDLDFVSNQIKNSFKHLKYEFHKIKIPRVITVINNVDYLNKVILADSLLFISIDTYMGKKNDLYQGIPKYIRNTMSIEFLVPNIIEKFSDKLIKKSKNKNFISEMIFYGKKLYFKDIILPNHSDLLKNEYTKEQYDWINENEIFIWRYFVDKELLYVNDEKLYDRFLLPGPFSKFYLEIDKESPPRVGQWVGLQIVKSYVANNPKISLKELLSISNEEIFLKSKYKPRKIWQ